MKVVDIIGFHQFLWEGVTKNNIYEELKYLRGGGGGWYLDAHYDLTLVHDET